MSVRQAVLLGFEEMLNLVAGFDPHAAARLAGFHGSVFGVEILGLGLRFYLAADQAGRIQVLSELEGEPDCLVRGAPLDLARSVFTAHKEDALMSGRVEIRGDTDLAHRFSRVLGDLDIDWEEQLARVVGDVAAHETGNAVRLAGGWASRTGAVTEENLREYLQEEARLLPTRYEITEWQDEVDRLRDDVERLAARVARLPAATEGPGEDP